MTDLVGKRFKYLDHGYVELIEYMGSDTAIAQAARTSFGEGEYEDPKRNQGLINYLVEHQHTSPLEMPVLRFALKMPIFVARQHVRHRTASLNEYSLRYAEQEGDYYLPPVERFCYKNKWNHQGSGDPLDEQDAKIAQEILRVQFEGQWESYKKLLAMGVSNEIARCALGVNFYTVMVWQMDLHNLFHYLRLRNDPHSQDEIREMASIIENIVAKLFPMCYNAFSEFVKGAKKISKTELELIASSSNVKEVLEEVDNVLGSKRRAKDLREKFRTGP